MMRETTMTQGLRATDHSAAYDAACKRLLSEKIILAWIMKSCLEEFRNCEIDEIAGQYIEGQPQVGEIPVTPDAQSAIIHGLDTEDKSLTEGTVTFDIRFHALAPVSGERIRLIINIEAQNDFFPGYPLLKRGVYYCCRMISSQYGREFTDAHYENIKKVYSIWICMNPPKNRRNTITRYRMTEESLVGSVTEPIKHYDLLSILMICLGGPGEDNYSGILRLLDVLLSNDTDAQEKKQILQDDYKIPMTQVLESEVSVMCNLSKGVWEKGMEKGIAQGLEQGLERGLEQGMAQGLTKGRTDGILCSLQSLMETMGLTVEQAMAALKIPEGERQTYARLLEK